MTKLPALTGKEVVAALRYRADKSCIALHAVAGGCWPMTSPPWKQVFVPPPRSAAVQSVVKNCAVEASILVLAARTLF